MELFEIQTCEFGGSETSVEQAKLFMKKFTLKSMLAQIKCVEVVTTKTKSDRPHSIFHRYSTCQLHVDTNM